MRRWMYALISALVMSVLAVGALVSPALVYARSGSFIGQFNTVSTLASTVPGNGDVNPYGVATVPSTSGHLVRGNILVSNFNNSANLQGTGTTIVQITPHGKQSLFAHIAAAKLPGACPGGVGLTTALVVLSRGWVIVGSLPTSDGTSANAKAGCLIVLDSNGKVAETISGHHLNGPWDMTVADFGGIALLFVTNVLNGTVANSPNVVNRGTVVRLTISVPRQSGEDAVHHAKPRVFSSTVIGSGFPERTDSAALVIGPTGVALNARGTLYVADSLNNRIAAISNAVTRSSSAGDGKTIARNGALNDPLGLTLAPNGDILSVNGNDGNIVETTPRGVQVATKLLDATGSPAGAGTLFGLATVPGGHGVYFVDDGTNTLNLLH